MNCHLLSTKSLIYHNVSYFDDVIITICMHVVTGLKNLGELNLRQNQLTCFPKFCDGVQLKVSEVHVVHKLTSVAC